MKTNPIKTKFRHSDYGVESALEGEEERNERLNDMAPSIGWIIIEFNSLESEIDFLLKEKLSASESRDEIAYLFLVDMSMSRKIQMLGKLYRIWLSTLNEKGKEIEKTWSSLETNLISACQIRNKYAHVDWTEMYSTKDKNVFKVKTTAENSGVYHKFEEIDIEEDLDILQDLHQKIEEFDEKFGEHF